MKLKIRFTKKAKIFSATMLGGFAIYGIIRMFCGGGKTYKSPYYSIADMFRSAKAKANGIDNTTTDETILANLLSLLENVVDPVREEYGARIIITSGYRCPKVNALVGGATNSQHTKGEAADLDTGTKAGNVALFNVIRQLGKYDQLINENDYSWIHVSWKRNGANRRQILSISKTS